MSVGTLDEEGYTYVPFTDISQVPLSRLTTGNAITLPADLPSKVQVEPRSVSGTIETMSSDSSTKILPLVTEKGNGKGSY
jgi:hypothetical protein